MRRMGWTAAFIAMAVAVTVAILAVTTPGRFAHPRVVEVRNGASIRTVAHSLTRAGVVRSTYAFIGYAVWTGNAGRIKPGDYVFPGGESLGTILQRLVSGNALTIAVTIPEGLTLHQIGERLQQAGLACDSEFDTAARDGPIPRALGLGALGAEGFLFPATYRFAPTARTDEVLATMLQRFYAVLTPAVEQRMFELGIDTRQLVTLASIIEKEARVPSERPVIASVFYNRLAAGMPLQSDPTAEYNLAGETERAVVAVHSASAFNTYTIAGLPPGPIANPGLSSIEATLYPAHTDYLYFVARSDGTHVFSRTFKEHQAAIRRLAAHSPTATASKATGSMRR